MRRVERKRREKAVAYTTIISYGESTGIIMCFAVVWRNSAAGKGG
jgi:hypothetical protein